MVRKKKIDLSVRDVVDGLNNLVAQRPLLLALIPFILVLWGVEKWIFSLSSWVPLLLAVWATLQYGKHQQHLLVEELDRKWKRIIQNSSPVTPLEQCQWLNWLSAEVWPNYMNPKLSTKFSSIVEKRLRNKKSRLIERVRLQEFSLGSNPPSLGLQGAYWSTSGDQKIMHLGFDWDTNEMSVLLLAKLGKPLKGTVGIIINSLHIKGDLLLMPVLDGKAVLYSFVATPEVRIGREREHRS
uniref:SMP-LTD domain-containing protein n=1 Tax=Kalanchoe fedtschenkoi TaxID=63787 RepID=A0A7N0TNW7_KALFE